MLLRKAPAGFTRSNGTGFAPCASSWTATFDIYSRNGNRCTQQYPELSVLPHYLKARSAILDGEMVVLDDKGRPRFNLIQPRISVSDPNSIAHLSRSTPVNLFLFDVVYLDGYDLRAVPLLERKRILAEIVTPSDRIHVSDYFRDQWSRDAGSGAPERPGRHYCETKRQQIRGAPYFELAKGESHERTGVRHRRLHARRTLLFQLTGSGGLRGDGKLVHAGQVGTGFNEKNLARDIRAAWSR